MATQLHFKPIPGTGNGEFFARIRRKSPKIDVLLATKIILPVSDWERYKAGEMSEIAQTRFRNKYSKELGYKDSVTAKLDSAVEGLSDGISNRDFSKQARAIIHSVVHADMIEEERRREAEEDRRRQEAEQQRKMAEELARKNDFMDYYENFVSRIRDDSAKKIGKGAGASFSERTIINYQQGYRWLKDFQEKELAGRGISFDDIDKQFFDRYQRYLETRELVRGKGKGTSGCSQNTISMRIAELKTVLRRANEVDGVTENDVFRNKAIRVDDVEIDAIALTRKELSAICEVDLSSMPKGYEIARDIFMCGVWTAQRVSDYNNIKPEDIKQEEVDTIVKDEHGKKTVKTASVTFIEVTQKKTGARVAIPVNSQLKAILEKYGNDIPHLSEQKINSYIKEIAKIAGLTDKVTVTATKGGKKTKSYIEKYNLVHSHTARRTGATLMYMAGLDIYDIMKITGHTSIDTLKKYIRANDGDSAYRIAAKYEYFK